MEQIARNNGAATPGQDESVFISYASGARQLAFEVINALTECQLRHESAEKHTDPGENLDASTRAAIERCDFFLLVCTPSCLQQNWIQHEIHLAAHLQKPLLFYVENLNLTPPMHAKSALCTDNTARLAGYFAYSVATHAELQDFLVRLLGSNNLAELDFRLARSDHAKVWRRAAGPPESDVTQPADGLSLAPSAGPTETPVELLEIALSIADVGSGCALRLGYGSPGRAPIENYVVSFERKLRGVLVDPRKPGSLAIGIRSNDPETGSELLRAGTPTVDDQIFGRDLYGWHARESFWRAALVQLDETLASRSGES